MFFLGFFPGLTGSIGTVSTSSCVGSSESLLELHDGASCFVHISFNLEGLCQVFLSSSLGFHISLHYKPQHVLRGVAMGILIKMFVFYIFLASWEYLTVS